MLEMPGMFFYHILDILRINVQELVMVINGIPNVKLSFYNILIPIPGEEMVLIYNSRTNSLLGLNRDQLSCLTSLGPSDPIDQYIDTETVASLMEFGILIADDIDEIAEVNNKDRACFENILNRKDYFELTLCPTYACNLRCVYCYENVIGEDSGQTISHMSKDVQNEVIEYYAKHCKIHQDEKDPRILDKITWYGGEPLLRPGIIDEMQGRFNDIAQEYGRNIEANIVTNGTLLSLENQQVLKQNNIKYIQITLDGPSHIHNKRRPCVNEPNNSFERIIDNLKSIDDYFNITIRINLDETNHSTLDELLSVLIENNIWPKRNIDLKIKNTLKYRDKSIEGSFSQKDFNDIELQFRKKKVDIFNKIMSGDKKASLKYIYPTTLKKTCKLSLHPNVYVVGPDGKLFSCWDNVGNNKFSCGNITDLLSDSEMPVKGKFDYLAFRKNMKCYDCQYLPICSVECPGSHLRGHKATDQLNCSKWKFILQDTLVQNFLKENEVQ